VIHRLAPSEESLSNAVVDVYSALKPALAVWMDSGDGR